MISTLGDFRSDYNFTLDILDIDESPELLARFNVLVPALYLGDVEICHHFLDLHSLVRTLDDFRSEPGKQLE